MSRGKPGVHAFDLPKPEINQPDEVLIRVIEVGVDGTDYNMVRHNSQDIAEDHDQIVMGHEMVGQVAPYVSSQLKTSILENFVAILFVVLSLALFWISLSDIM